MVAIAGFRIDRWVIAMVAAFALAACGPDEADKSKAEKKVEPPAPPKAAPPAPPPAPKKEAKPVPKAETDTGGWVLLGEQRADRKSGKDRFEIGGRKEGKFRELRVTVKGAPVTIEQMVITLGNGKQVTRALKGEIKPGASQVVDLPGEQRAIRHIDLVYRAGGGAGKATVSVHGR